MKKKICLLMALVLGLSLCACGKGQEAQKPFPPAETTQALMESGAYTEQLEKLDLDIAVMMFWLGGEVSDYAGSEIYYSTGATAEIAAVISVADESKVSEVEQALKVWVESQIEAEKTYRPAEAAKLEEAIIEVRGASVALAVAADREKAAAVLAEQ